MLLLCILVVHLETLRSTFEEISFHKYLVCWQRQTRKIGNSVVVFRSVDLVFLSTATAVL